MKFLLALDIAKDTLVAVLKDENGRTLFPAKEFANNTRGFKKLLTAMTDPPNTHVIFEATGVYTKALIHALDGTVAGLHQFNPCILKRLGTSMVQTKTDPADANAIAEAGCLLLAGKPEILEQNRISFNADRENLAAWLAEHQRLTHATVVLKQQIDNLTHNPASAAEEILNRRRDELQQLKQRQREIRKQIESELKAHADKDAQLVQSITGVGVLTTSAALVAIRRIDRFQNVDALKGYLGTYPRRIQSGKHERPSRMAQHGNRLFRHMLWNAAKSAARHNPVCKELFDRLVANGKTKPAAYGAVCRKLVHLIYGVLKTRKPFDIKHNAT